MCWRNYLLVNHSFPSPIPVKADMECARWLAEGSKPPDGGSLQYSLLKEEEKQYYVKQIESSAPHQSHAVDDQVDHLIHSGDHTGCSIIGVLKRIILTISSSVKHLIQISGCFRSVKQAVPGFLPYDRPAGLLLPVHR